MGGRREEGLLIFLLVCFAVCLTPHDPRAPGRVMVEITTSSAKPHSTEQLKRLVNPTSCSLHVCLLVCPLLIYLFVFTWLLFVSIWLLFGCCLCSFGCCLCLLGCLFGCCLCLLGCLFACCLLVCSWIVVSKQCELNMQAFLFITITMCTYIHTYMCTCSFVSMHNSAWLSAKTHPVFHAPTPHV